MADAERNHPATLTQLPRIPEGEPPEELSGLAREHPALLLLGGFALGLAVGALLPRGAGRRFAQRAAAIAAGASEAGLLLGRLAVDRADDATRGGRTRIAEGAGEARRRALKAARGTRDAGATMIRKAARGVRNIRS